MKKIFGLLIASVFLFSGCDKDKDDDNNPGNNPPAYQKGNVSINFENVVNGIHVDVSGNTQYQNAMNETFTVTMFKYYISNVILHSANGDYNVPESYYLINEEDINQRSAVLSDIPGGEYTGVSFTVGVDSTRNVSGAQTGALDPTNGMFWSWNTGYIFLKLEGKTPLMTDTVFQFHIGGFKESLSQNANRVINLSFGPDKLIVDGSREAEIHVMSDILEIFKTPEDITFNTVRFVMMPGNSAMTIANNYADMFVLDHLHNGN